MRKIMYLISISVAIFVITIVGDAEFYYTTGQNEKHTAPKSGLQSSMQNLNLVTDCMQFQTLDSLASCKGSISHLKKQCASSEYSSMEVCKDPRIEQFLGIVDYKIMAAKNQMAETTSEWNSSISHLINLCSQSDIPSCQTTMEELEQECTSEEWSIIQSCSDPRIVQIIAKNVNRTSVNEADFQDQVMSFIDTCSSASGNSTITACATTARQIMSLCQSALTPTCSDDRLQQIANMGLNSVIISKIDQTNRRLQAVLDKCYSKISNQAECTDYKTTITESCNSNLKPYFPICYDPRIQNLTR